MGTALQITKRAFMIGGVAVGGGMVVGYAYLRDKPGTAGFEDWGQKAEALNAWVKITPANEVVIAVPHAEMGQGVYTAIPMLICEELEVDLDSVRVEHPDLDGKYINEYPIKHEVGLESGPILWVIMRIIAKMPMIATGGSSTIRGRYDDARRIGAATREMLIAEAADRWGVAPSECYARKGQVHLRGQDYMFTYGELAEAAALRDMPSDIPLKEKKNFHTVGTPQRRLDIPAKVKGEATFGIDVVLPGMLYAVPRFCPHHGGTVAAYNIASVETMPGFKAVVPITDGVAVVATSTWRAMKIANALDITFDPGDGAGVTHDTVAADLRQALTGDTIFTAEEDGDVAATFAASDDVFEASYDLPYLAHTCMEPMNATVRVQGDQAEVWSGSQSPTLAANGVEQGTGISTSNVTTYNTFLGGGFGRRAEQDFVRAAAEVAKAFEGTPIKMTWPREEDVRRDIFRPAAAATFKATLDEQGGVSALHARVALQSVMAGVGERFGLAMASPETDKTMEDGLKFSPYHFASRLIDKAPYDNPILIGNWRSVGHSHNAFFMESFIDELAHHSGQDPFAFRAKLLQNAPRQKNVLAHVARIANWESPIGAGRGRGIALHTSFESTVGEVAEVSVAADGSFTVDRVYCVIDCGPVVNPDTVKAQMESGIVYGLTAALYGEVTFEDGAAQQSNFTDYEALRLYETPEMIVEIVESDDRIGGVGEPSTPPIAPAVTNAIFNAVGIRVRTLPLMNVNLRIA